MSKTGLASIGLLIPPKKTIDQLILREGTFELAGTFDSSQTLTSPALEEFTLPIDKVFIDP